jgi:hypothetical protein
MNVPEWKRPLHRLALAACVLLGAGAAGAAGTTEVVVANIATRGFDVFLRTPAPPAASRLDVFRDAGGTLPATALTIEKQALFTGPTVGDDYARRCAERLARTAMTEAGNTLFRVSGAEPGAAYFVRVVYDAAAWPATGLHGLSTLSAGEWRTATHQMLVDVARPGDGWVGTLSTPDALAPLLAVCGDGTYTNTAFFFNLADLADGAGAPLTPADGTPMTFRLYGRSGAPATERTLVYAAPASNDAAVAILSTELAPLLRLMIASSVAAVCEPPPGESFYFDGIDIACRLTQSVVTQVDTQFVGYGWTGTGNVPVSGRATSFTFTLTTDSEINWRWRTNFWLEVESEHGAVDLASGWYRAGAGLTASVTPEAEWLFRKWSGVADGADSVAAFTVTAPGTLMAEYDPALVPGGEGMPEWWLTKAGLTGADRDPLADSDQDGMSNLKEWLADTSPTNNLSDLRITALQRGAGGAVNLVWRGGREARQIIEMIDGDLARGDWRPVSTNIPPTETIGSCIIQLAGRPRVFFRIKAER